jgi:hypothetical protein
MTTFGLCTDMIGQTSTGKTAAIKAKRAQVVLSLAIALTAAGSVSAADKERPTPSGYPVPRYISIKVDPANARSGPSEDHRLLWVYHAKGLPVQVVAENQTWRRICDPEGGLAWVHMRVTDGRRTVMQDSLIAARGDGAGSRSERPKVGPPKGLFGGPIPARSAARAFAADMSSAPKTLRPMAPTCYAAAFPAAGGRSDEDRAL